VLPANAAEPARSHGWTASLSADQRAQLAVKAMTQEEKLRWVFAYFGADFGQDQEASGGAAQSAGYIAGTPRLGLPALFETDAGLGVATQASRPRASVPRCRPAWPRRRPGIRALAYARAAR
jgi:beta-glucosidase